MLLQEVNGQVAGGGVSLHYSHSSCHVVTGGERAGGWRRGLPPLLTHTPAVMLLQEVNGQVAGGGVSLHYSHTLQLLQEVNGQVAGGGVSLHYSHTLQLSCCYRR